LAESIKGTKKYQHSSKRIKKEKAGFYKTS